MEDITGKVSKVVGREINSSFYDNLINRLTRLITKLFSFVPKISNV